MSGIRELSILLSSMEPSLEAGEFVYCTVGGADPQDYLHLKPRGLFQEAEGLTLILPAETARAAGLTASAPLHCITLNVHSSLEAVGLTAAVSAALSEEGISANVVAAYYHDHVFVPTADAARALKTLRALSARSSAS